MIKNFAMSKLRQLKNDCYTFDLIIIDRFPLKPYFCLPSGSTTRSFPVFYTMPPFPHSISVDITAETSGQSCTISSQLRRRIVNYLFEELKSYDW